jgi:hypothetical protein
MTRQSSNDRQFCAAQILEAAGGQKYCAAQMGLARTAGQQYAYTGMRDMPERRVRGISADAETAVPAI